MRHIIWALAGVMLFTVGALSQTVRPKPSQDSPILQTQVERELDDLTKKVQQLQTQVTQLNLQVGGIVKNFDPNEQKNYNWHTLWLLKLQCDQFASNPAASEGHCGRARN